MFGFLPELLSCSDLLLKSLQVLLRLLVLCVNCFLFEGDVCIFSCQCLVVGHDPAHSILQLFNFSFFVVKGLLQRLFLVFFCLNFLLQVQKFVVLGDELVFDMFLVLLEHLQVVIQVSDLLVGAFVVFGTSCWLLTTLDVLFLLFCDSILLLVSVFLLIQDGDGQVSVNLLHLLDFQIIVDQALGERIDCFLVLSDQGDEHLLLVLLRRLEVSNLLGLYVLQLTDFS